MIKVNNGLVEIFAYNKAGDCELKYTGMVQPSGGIGPLTERAWASLLSNPDYCNESLCIGGKVVRGYDDSTPQPVTEDYSASLGLPPHSEPCHSHRLL